MLISPRVELSISSVDVDGSCIIVSYTVQSSFESEAAVRSGMGERSFTVAFVWLSRQCCMWSSSRSGGGGGMANVDGMGSEKKTFFSLYFSEGKKVVDVFVIF